VESNEDIDKLDLGQTDTEPAPESAPESQYEASDFSLRPPHAPIEEIQFQD
jgi:hypothetical protein